MRQAALAVASSLRLAFCSLLSLPAEGAGDCSFVERLALCHCAREGLSARAFGQAEPASVSIDVERPGQDFDSEIVGLSSQVSRLKQVRVRGRVAMYWELDSTSSIGLLPQRCAPPFATYRSL